MTNYQRLISYIYTHEGEVKGKNIGFAKLGSQNGRCKLNVNVKKVHVGSSDLGVYLLVSGEEILLGSIFIRSGYDEFRAVVNVENAANSDCNMDQYYDLTIHEQRDTWRAYTAIWEDTVAHTAEVELADVASSRLGGAKAQMHRKVEELNQELRSGEETSEDGDDPVLSSSLAEARQMHATGKQDGIQESSLKRAAETVETVQEAEVSVGTSEEVFQAEDEADQTAESSQGTEVLEQAAEKTVEAEEIVSEPVEAKPAEMSRNQNKQGDNVRQNNQESEGAMKQMETFGIPDAGSDLALESELLPDAEDRVEPKPESLPDEIREAQRSGNVPDFRLKCQSRKEAKPEKTVILRNKGPAGIIPIGNVERTNDIMMSDADGEQESDHGAWKGKWNFGGRQKP